MYKNALKTIILMKARTKMKMIMIKMMMMMIMIKMLITMLIAKMNHGLTTESRS